MEQSQSQADNQTKLQSQQSKAEESSSNSKPTATTSPSTTASQLHPQSQAQAPPPSRADTQPNDAERTAAQREREEKERLKAKESQRQKEERERELAHERALQREHETRILWYSLPHHDQTDVYSDTDASASSDISDIEPPIPNTRQPHYPPPSLQQDFIHLSDLDPPQASTSRTTLNHQRSSHSSSPSMVLNGHHSHRAGSSASAVPPLIRADSIMTGTSHQSNHSNNKRGIQSNDPTNDHDDQDDSDREEDDDGEDWGQEERKELYGNRSGNRGNKLRRSQGVRWARRRKLGTWTEARAEKEMADRARVRVASLQRAAIQSLLASAPLPHPASVSLSSDMDEVSRLSPSSSIEGLTSTTLAPSLLRPVITPRQLLASHTLKHTFRNPHIGALAKTALDLRESEGVVERALGRCFAAMEWDGRPLNGAENDINGELNGERNGNVERRRKKRKPNGDTDDEEEDEEDQREDDGENNLQEINGKGKENGAQVGGNERDEEMKSLKEGNDVSVQQNPNDGQSNNNGDHKMDLDESAESKQQGINKSNSIPGRSVSDQQQQQQAPVDHESSDVMSLSNGSSNPAFSRLEELFITPGGLPVSTIDPDQSHNSNDQQPPETSMTLLSVGNQRAIVRAALECLHELSSDSREYVERLEEVRNRLASVRRERSETWSALRNWSLDREEFRLGIARGERLGTNGNGTLVEAPGKNGNDGGKNEKKKGTARTNSLAAKRR